MEKEVNSEVYRFYKNQYPSGVILFHVGNAYEAYNKDAETVNKIASYDIEMYHPQNMDGVCSLSIDDSLLSSFIHECKLECVNVHIVSYIDNQGKCVLPKVKQILQDMEDDY